MGSMAVKGAVVVDQEVEGVVEEMDRLSLGLTFKTVPQRLSLLPLLSLLALLSLQPQHQQRPPIPRVRPFLKGRHRPPSANTMSSARTHTVATLMLLQSLLRPVVLS